MAADVAIKHSFHSHAVWPRRIPTRVLHRTSKRLRRPIIVTDGLRILLYRTDQYIPCSCHALLLSSRVSLGKHPLHPSPIFPPKLPNDSAGASRKKTFSSGALPPTTGRPKWAAAGGRLAGDGGRWVERHMKPQRRGSWVVGTLGKGYGMEEDFNVAACAVSVVQRWLRAPKLVRVAIHTIRSRQGECKLLPGKRTVGPRYGLHSVVSLLFSYPSQRGLCPSCHCTPNAEISQDMQEVRSRSLSITGIRLLSMQFGVGSEKGRADEK